MRDWGAEEDDHEFPPALRHAYHFCRVAHPPPDAKRIGCHPPTESCAWAAARSAALASVPPVKARALARVLPGTSAASEPDCEYQH
jgi:hypothetical protein